MDKYLGLNKESDFTSSFFMRLVLLIFVSSLSYLYIEKPLRTYIKNSGNIFRRASFYRKDKELKKIS